MPRVTVFYNNKKKELKTEKGKILLKLLRENGFGLTAPCGGKGSCGKCMVKVINPTIDVQGLLTKTEKNLLSDIEIKSGIRLACKIQIKDDIKIELIPDSLINTNNARILTKDITKFSINHRTEKKQNKYGLAVDLGTTTIVIYLMDLLTGEEKDLEALLNPQHIYGADVISRINFTLKEKEGRSILTEILIKEINQGINNLLTRNGIQKRDLVSACVAGNTVMLHFLTGTSVETFAKTPYKPVFTERKELKPGELGIQISDEGIVNLLPGISTFIGADIVADLLVTQFKDNTWRLLIDIGTNGEIILGNKDKILACSTAAGPAFEGAQITYGMGGVNGAISHYKINENNNREYSTIGGEKPRGICGSGLVDIIAELLKKGIIKKTGALAEKKKFFIVLPGKKTAHGEDIILTQKDIREFQLAVGAIRAGINVLSREAIVNTNEIGLVYLAGGFGNFIDIWNACLTGIIPFQLKNKVVRIGNGAGAGAKLYLLKKEVQKEAELLKKKTVYIELSGRNDFQEEFLNSLEFPPFTSSCRIS